MINKLGQVMLYIEDFDKAKEFWIEKLNFRILEENLDTKDMNWIEIVPESEGSSIVLIDKNFVAQMEPELNLDTPSLMFYTDDLDQLYSDFSVKEITLGEIVTMPTGERVFNFSDDEENYFAVSEK